MWDSSPQEGTEAARKAHAGYSSLLALTARLGHSPRLTLPALCLSQLSRVTCPCGTQA